MLEQIHAVCLHLWGSSGPPPLLFGHHMSKSYQHSFGNSLNLECQTRVWKCEAFYVLANGIEQKTEWKRKEGCPYTVENKDGSRQERAPCHKLPHIAWYLHFHSAHKWHHKTLGGTWEANMLLHPEVELQSWSNLEKSTFDKGGRVQSTYYVKHIEARGSDIALNFHICIQMYEHIWLCQGLAFPLQRSKFYVDECKVETRMYPVEFEWDPAKISRSGYRQAEK